MEDRRKRGKRCYCGEESGQDEERKAELDSLGFVAVDFRAKLNRYTLIIRLESK